MADPIDLREFGRLEAMVTARLKRHKYDAGWRGRVARWVAAHLLDAFDPDGKHI